MEGRLSALPLASVVNKRGAVTSSRFSSADGKHSADGSKVTEQELAKMRAIRDWCKDSCSYYNPKELRSPPGAEPLERKVATCPHQGNKNVFSFMFCKPDCARSATGRAFDRCNIKDNSSAPGSDEEQKATKHLEMTVDTSGASPVRSSWFYLVTWGFASAGYFEK